jgi:hypothetical protein
LPEIKKTCRDVQVFRREYDRRDWEGRNFEEAGARPVGFFLSRLINPLQISHIEKAKTDKMNKCASFMNKCA